MPHPYENASRTGLRNLCIVSVLLHRERQNTLQTFAVLNLTYGRHSHKFVLLSNSENVFQKIKYLEGICVNLSMCVM